ncbi:hypothetical protein MUK42_02030 [Musa troglodytarum]|uniref:Uncharacterized protein n=1 Tax=Musa troglodytarum TaxID=320322 RepID=A0A9E7EKQ0_9LILI|nr:hypothetical protein MUK42_02030 [Musa troglodytarum]
MVTARDTLSFWAEVPGLRKSVSLFVQIPMGPSSGSAVLASQAKATVVRCGIWNPRGKNDLRRPGSSDLSATATGLASVSAAGPKAGSAAFRLMKQMPLHVHGIGKSGGMVKVSSREQYSCRIAFDKKVLNFHKVVSSSLHKEGFGTHHIRRLEILQAAADYCYVDVVHQQLNPRLETISGTLH